MRLRILTCVLLLQLFSACSVGHPLVGLLPNEAAGTENTAVALLGLTGAALGGTTDGNGVACTPTFANGLYIGCDLSANLSGLVSTPYGPAQGTNPPGYADGTGNTARFQFPYDMTTDGVNLYVADAQNHTIRQIAMATGAVTTLAGNGTIGDADGTSTGARFSSPTGITTDGTNLYIADTGNNKIRQIVIASGVVTTLAGPGPGTTTSGNVDATGTAARFNRPIGITTDGTNLYTIGI